MKANLLNLLLAAAVLLLSAQLYLLRAGRSAAPAAAEPAAAPVHRPSPDAPSRGGAAPSVPGGDSSGALAALAAIRAVSADASPEAASAAPVSAEPAFREFNPRDDFTVNPFDFFTGAGLLLCAGDRSSHNAMTIGWGGLGTIWGRHDAVTVYVAENRHTRAFMDAFPRFTVMAFDKTAQADILRYMGTHSGRDGDKAAALGLHVACTPDGTPYYEEARMVLECETMYAAPFDPAGMKDVPRALYADFPAGVHTMYIGRIVRAMKK